MWRGGRRAHYYLLDLCYACNLLMLVSACCCYTGLSSQYKLGLLTSNGLRFHQVHIWVFPHSAFLHKVCLPASSSRPPP